jgi:hypothetical protein
MDVIIDGKTDGTGVSYLAGATLEGGGGSEEGGTQESGGDGEVLHVDWLEMLLNEDCGDCRRRYSKVFGEMTILWTL